MQKKTFVQKSSPQNLGDIDTWTFEVCTFNPGFGISKFGLDVVN